MQKVVCVLSANGLPYRKIGRSREEARREREAEERENGFDSTSDPVDDDDDMQL